MIAKGRSRETETTERRVEREEKEGNVIKVGRSSVADASKEGARRKGKRHGTTSEYQDAHERSDTAEVRHRGKKHLFLKLTLTKTYTQPWGLIHSAW